MGHLLGLSTEQPGELAFEPQPWMLLHHLLPNDIGHQIAGKPEHIYGRSGGEQEGLGAALDSNPGCEVQSDRIRDELAIDCPKFRGRQ